MVMKLLIRLNMFIVIYELDNSSHLIEMHEFRSYSLEKVSYFKSLVVFAASSLSHLQFRISDPKRFLFISDPCLLF